MHDAATGTHSASSAETLVLTNNLVYPEPSTYYDVININHRHHLSDHHFGHINHESQYHESQYNHDFIPSNIESSNNINDISLFHNQNSSENALPMQQQSEEHQIYCLNDDTNEQSTHHHHHNSFSQSEQQLEKAILVEPQQQATSETHSIDDIMIDSRNNQDSSEPIGTSILELNERSPTYETIPSKICNTETIVTSDSNNALITPLLTPNDRVNQQLYLIDGRPNNVESESELKSLCHITSKANDENVANGGEEEEDDDEIEDGDDDDDAEDDDDDDDGDEEDDDDEVCDEDDEDDDEDDDDDDDDDQSEDDCEDIVDPGQHCQLIQQSGEETIEDLIERDDSREAGNDILDGERMLEVTRKLVRDTERDPDRDLRKQVLLKTAIKKLPHFMEYNRYSDSLDRSFHSNISPQAYYEHHDSQQKFYHSVQPNAIQMSTTSLRMLDLNDDHDPELVNIDQDHQDPNLGYNNRTSLDHNDYVSQHQYDRYHQRQHDTTQYETGNPMISRHNSLDNLYQQISANDLNEDMKDGDERIPIAFQIACEIYDFTCAPDDNERKLLDNLTNAYYTRPTKEPRTNESDDGGEDGTETRDQDGSDTSSSSHSSSSDESANSIVSQSTESDEANGTSLLEASLNSSSEFYHSSHDSGVVLFSPRSNKRSSSSIGLEDEMEIDHLTELSTRSPSIGTNNQYKKLRKREIID